MQKIFLYDNVNNRIELNVPEILLIREFKALMDKKRNITPKDKEGKLGTQAFKEFTYIWLALDWLSPYADYAEQERHQQNSMTQYSGQLVENTELYKKKLVQ